MQDFFKEAENLMREQIGENSDIALATCRGGEVGVRTVNGHYRGGAVYILTNTATHKMKDLSQNPNAAVCKGMLQAEGNGENLGNPLDEKNRTLREELKKAFASFYETDLNESDPGCCILKITLKSAVVFSKTAKYAVDFPNRAAQKFPFRNTVVYQ